MALVGIGHLALEQLLPPRASTCRAKDEFREHPAIAAKQQFALELDHLADRIRTKKQPYMPGEEGLQDLRVIDAIRQSAREGKRIELPKVAALDAFRGPISA